MRVWVLLDGREYVETYKELPSIKELMEVGILVWQRVKNELVKNVKDEK